MLGCVKGKREGDKIIVLQPNRDEWGELELIELELTK